MKKITYSFLMLLMAMLFLPFNGMARTDVTFDFKANPWELPLGSGTGATADAGNITAPIEQDGVSLSFNQSSSTTPARMWTGPELRVYKSSTFTFEAPSDKVIEKIEFAGSTVAISTETGTYVSSTKTWTQPAEQVNKVTFSVTANSKITKAVLTIAAPGEAEEVVELPTAENIAAFKALGTDVEAVLTLADAKVVYVKGNDMFVEDATGAIDFYQLGLTATSGQVLNGTITGKNAVYSGLPQMAKTSNTDVATVNVTDGDAPVAVEMTVADAMAETSYLKYVKITDATLVSEGNTYYLANGDNKIQIYNKFKLDYTLPEAIKSFAGIIIPYVKNGTTDVIVEIAPIAVEDIIAAGSESEPVLNKDITAETIVNPGFELSDATAVSIGTSGSAQGTDYESTGWKLYASAIWSNSAVFAYGGEAQLNGVSVPAADNAGEAGKALGVTVGWSGKNAYKSAADVTLPAGFYTLKANAYNAGTAAQFKSALGFVAGDKSYISSKASFALNTWEADEVDFVLDAETTGHFTIGGTAFNAGSGANGKVFFDNITLVYSDLLSGATFRLAEEIVNAKAVAEAGYADKTELLAAIATAEAVTSTDYQEVLAACDALAAIVAAYNEANAPFVAFYEFKAKYTFDDADYPYATAEKAEDLKAALAKVPATAEEIETVETEIILAARIYVESNALAENVESAENYTASVVNPNAEALEGWTVEKSNGVGYDIKNGEPFTDAAGNSTHTYFDGGNWGGNNWTVTQSQSVSLPKGKYLLSVTSRASTDMTTFDLFAGNDATAMLHVGNTGELFDRGWNLATLEFEVADETADVVLGVRGVANTTKQWMSFTRFNLMKIDVAEPGPEPEPVIADGTYYLYNEAGKVFFERGAAWGTQATVGKYGLPVDIKTVGGATTLAMHDWAGTVIGMDEGIYTDVSGKDARTYTIKSVEGGFVFVNNNNYALTIVDGVVNGVLDGEGSVWTVKTLEERNAILEAATAADKSAAIAAAGYPEDVEFEVTDCTEKVASASLAESIEGWTWTEVRKGNNATNEYGSERYQATGTLIQTVTGLEPGLYRVTVNGLYRDGSNANQVAMAANGYYNSTAYLAANGVQAQITPWAKDRVADDNPNSMADYKAIIDADATKYLSEVYTTVGEDGEMAVSINIPSFIYESWCIFSNVTLTRLSYTAPEPEPTLPEAGTYYLKNVATGKFLAAGSSWGTRAIANNVGMDLTLAVLEDGKYTIDTQITNGEGENYLGSNQFCDKAAFGWTLSWAKTSTDEDALMISDGTGYLTIVDGNIDIQLGDNEDDYSKWVLLTEEDRLAELATATAEDGKDATWLLPGYNFGRNDMRNNNWNDKPAIGGEQTNNCAEKYNTTFDVNQTITVPNGMYKVEIQGFYRNGGFVDAAAKHNDGSEQLLAAAYANTVETPLQSIFTEAGKLDVGVTTDGIDGKFPNSMTDASAYFTAGLYNNVIENVIVVDGTLKVGVKKSETVDADWSIFDNIRLTYYGEITDLTVYREAYEAALAAAQAALADETNAVITGEERTALETAIEANSTVEETKDAYVAATTALNEALDAFNAAKAAYKALADAKAKYEAFDTNAYPYAAVAKVTAITEAVAATATSAEDATAKTAAIVTAVRTFVESNALAEDMGALDFTSSIINANAEAVESWNTVLGEGSGGSIVILSNEPFTDAEGNSTHSYFDGGNWGANAWDVAYSQDVTLPSGQYLLSVTSRASAEMTSFDLFAGEYQKEMTHVGASGEIFDRGWNDNFVVFDVHEDNSVVTLGVHGVADVQHQWMSFTRFRLVRLGNPDAINNVNVETLDNATVYSVNGQIVRTNAKSLNGLAKGVYVVNGKKVVVK